MWDPLALHNIFVKEQDIFLEPPSVITCVEIAWFYHAFPSVHCFRVNEVVLGPSLMSVHGQPLYAPLIATGTVLTDKSILF